ncbi:sigma factor-like helix-turn-helix DNA-binding protein [Nonomuraea sp. NPDC049419]|uniref:sigma factor-like helix-turn-helix DNA-binding protein n=1 Tax=Nonomuraea sp. NPDC049419 TaxID=3155772 RepID=UPI00342B20D0
MGSGRILDALAAASSNDRADWIATYGAELAAHGGGESLGDLLKISVCEPVDIRRYCSAERARDILLANSLQDRRVLLQTTVPELRGLTGCDQRTLKDVLNALLASLVEGDVRDRGETVQNEPHATLHDLLELWTSSLDDRQRLILRHRMARRDRSLDDLGNELGVSRARVGQLEKKLADNFAAWRQSSPVAERIGQFHWWVFNGSSPLMTFEAVSARVPELSDLVHPVGIELSNFLEMLLPDLDVDGPWLATKPLSDLRDVTFYSATHREKRSDGGYDLDKLQAELGLDDYAWSSWLEYCGLRKAAGIVVRKGASQPELAVAVLAAAGHPLSVEEIAERLQVDGVRSLRGRLQADDRIARVGPNSYGLPEWNLETYEGIREEIVQRIERGGGRVLLADVVDELVEQFGVSPASVRAYAARREFSRRDGWIRLAGNGDDGPSQASRKMPTPGETRRCFFLRGQWWFRVDINKEVLRGSGFTAPRGVMALFQVAEGTERVFAALAQEIRISWAAPQPQFGSIRSLVTQLQAKIGDVLWLAPTDRGAVRARLVRAWNKTEDDEIALRSGVQRGLSGEDLRLAVAGALALSVQTSWAALVMSLRARGDLDLAEIVEGYTLSESCRALDSVPGLDDFFAALGGR